MKALNELVLELAVVDKQRGADYPANFERVLSEIAALNSADSIVPLIGFFDDSAPYDEIMFSIIHFIESFDDRIYIAHLLKAAGEFCKRSPRWSSVLFVRTLNNDASRHELVRQLGHMDQETKLSVRDLMQEINARGAQFLSKTTEVIAAAS